MTPIRSCIAESTDNRPRDLYWCSSLEMFLVSFLYERRFLRIEVLKIKCSWMLRLTSGFFIFWIDNVCFAEHPTQRPARNLFYLMISSWNSCHSDGLLFMPFLRCSFRIIFILIRYVATISMKAFYDEALRIAFKHCYDFQLVSILSIILIGTMRLCTFYCLFYVLSVFIV